MVGTEFIAGGPLVELGDVLQGADETADVAVLIAQRAGFGAHPERPAVGVRARLIL